MNTFLNKYRNQIVLFTGTLLALGIVLGVMGHKSFMNTLLIIATFFAGIPVAAKAIQALSMKAFSIELLVTIAVVGALFIGEYIESSVVSFLFLFGAFLETRTLQKTRSALKKLIDMAPQEATVLRNEKEETISVDDVIVGDRIIVRSGGKIPVDGRIVQGMATINEATITGESVPATKTLEDRVFGGTIVDNGYMELIAEKVGDDTTFAKIIELVEEAQESKSKTEKFLDKFAAIYTPAVIVLAVIFFLFTKDFHLAITFLVIACPGALVIGAPVSNVAGIGNGAKNGVLIKGGEVMDRLSEIDTVVFDKTGTLTKGKPEVINIKSFSDIPADELLRLVAQAEIISEHHLGQTIVKSAQSKGIFLDQKVTDGEIIKGKGISAVVGNRQVLVGNLALMESRQITLSDEALKYVVERQKAGNTAVYAAVENRFAGIISIMDQIRDDAKTALSAMRKNGVKKMIMLTGDNKHTAELVSNELGLDEFYAELLPENKVEMVKKLKAEGRNVAMAGDGINDAPAIAIADIGLAMGEGGTDVSMETADVVLMADKLMQFSHAYSLSKATMRNMKQNTFFAVSISFALIAGVVINRVHLASGMFIHIASVLLVILNAMRLINFGLKKSEST